MHRICLLHIVPTPHACPYLLQESVDVVVRELNQPLQLLGVYNGVKVVKNEDESGWSLSEVVGWDLATVTDHINICIRIFTYQATRRAGR